MVSEASLFSPKGRLVLTEADIQQQEAADAADELDLSKTDQTHPFDRPDFANFLKQEFPDLSRAVTEAARPTKSESPDELEEWESTRILKRRDRFPTEEDWSYLERFLYEEFFSVNQAPQKNTPPMRQGVPGLTPGGLVSHFFNETVINEIPLQNIVDRPFKGRTMPEAIKSMIKVLGDALKPQSVREFVDRVQFLTRRNDDINPLVPWNVLRHRFSNAYEGRANYQAMYPQIDSIGFRLLALMKSNPELLEPIKDEELKKLIGLDPKTEMSKSRFFVKAWNYFQKLFSADANKKELVTTLLKLRVHPEMQIFFKYLSPSGYINEWLAK